MKKLSSVMSKACLLILAMSMLLLTACGGSTVSVAYMKDNQLYYGKSQITTQFLDEFYTQSGKLPNAFELDNLVLTSEDGKIIYYPEKYMTGNTFTLYCKSGNSGAVTVCESVLSYKISADGKTAVYKDKDDNLYKFSNNKSTLIRADVASYKISKDGNRILFVTVDHKLYMQDKSRGLTLLGSEVLNGSSVEYITYCDENYDTVYFTTNVPSTEVDTTDESGLRLFVCTDGKDVKQVGKNLTNATHYFPETGEFYYLVSESYRKYYYIDYVTNDLGAEGEQSLENLKYSGYSLSIYSLWRCDGEKSEQIATNVGAAGTGVYNGKECLVYRQYETLPVEKLALSKATSTKIIDEHIESLYHNFVNLSVTSKGQTSVLSQTDKDFYALTNDTLYFREGSNGSSGGKLYLSKIKDGKAGEPQQIDNVYYARMLGDTIVYIKDYVGANDSYGGNLYFGDKKVADNVMMIRSFLDAEKNEKMYALSGYNTKTRYSDLSLIEGDRLTKISADVSYDNIFNYRGGLVYIKSSDIETLTGTLCYYNDGKSSEISKNVYAAFKCE